MKRLGRTSWIAAGAVFLLALAVLGLPAYAVLSIRCCGATRGAEPGAWVLVGAVVLAMAAAAAALTGGLAEIIRRLAGRTRKGQ